MSFEFECAFRVGVVRGSLSDCAVRSPSLYFTVQLRFATLAHELDTRQSQRDIMCRSRNDPAACGIPNTHETDGPCGGRHQKPVRARLAESRFRHGGDSMRRAVRTLSFVAMVLCLPTLAWAQAAIAGEVRDTSGAVLPGVTVEASSPALIEKVRTAVTDGNGVYRIIDLRPGTYTVTFTLGGFSTVRRENVELQGTQTVTVGADLRVGALEETITVTGEALAVDTQSVTQQRVVSREVLDAIPTGGTVHNLAALIPGAVMSATGGSAGAQDVGGSTLAALQQVAIHGGRA